MSGRAEKQEKSSSKVLKKARSFRDDFKVLIKRRPSSNQSMSPIKSPRSNGKGGKSGLTRHNSMNEGTKVEKLIETHDDIDKLRDEVANVHRSLGYIKEVVDKEKLQILPGSATIVLDTIMEVFTLLSNYFMNQESSTLISRHNQVYQSLARFIRWSDDILLHGDKALNKDNANEVIRALSDGVKELTQISIDKLEHRKTSSPTSPGTNATLPENNYSSKTCSLPDIPLTPREREILAETSVDTGMYDNTDRLSQSNDSLTNNYVTLSGKESSAPPKPPLPCERLSPNQQGGPIGRPSSGEAILTSATPPPLPQKRRSQGGSDLVTSTPEKENGQVSNVSPHNSMAAMSPASELATMSLSSHLAMLSQSPRSTSPLSRSPASSVGSGLNQSTEDLLGMSGKCSSLTNSISVTSSSNGSTPTSDPSVSMYDNMNLPVSDKIPGMTQCVNQINQLTFKINQLTTNIEEKPPSLPDKKRQFGRFPSTYDNLPEGFFQMSGTKMVMGRMFESRTSSMSSSRSLTTCSITQRTSSQETYSSSETFSSTSHSSMESLPNRLPPPLPPKKRHIHAYMQTIGSYTQPSALEYLPRHSVNFYESQWHRHQEELFQPLQVRSNTISVMSDLSSESSDHFSLDDGFISASPPALPTKQKALPSSNYSSTSAQSDFGVDLREKASSLIETPTTLTVDFSSDLKRSSAPANMDEPSAEMKPMSPKPDIQKDADSDFAELNPLDDVDVSDQMVRKKKGEEGPDIRGGTVDALIVHATTAGKNGSEDHIVKPEDLMYQEAFLTTYRTFISPRELIDKLLYRFHKFHHCSDHKKRASRNAFSLLVRIIDELSSTELDDSIIQRMMDLVFELLCQGELMLARILRRKVIEKCEARKRIQEANKFVQLLSSKSISTHPPDLLQFKSHDLAEQMTLMDATLFQKIEIPEVLLWAKEQSEELSPNLTLFTEHFNKMSYWCRTKILVQEEAKDREKYLMKFIKIMRHLRKISNFNSYLAILSALDSAPVRRLEWQKQNMEALKEFCQLIDSSSSFRAYRQALGETEPPCIPYIGLILQDLTFINIGNPDYLSDGSINFAKRWQQFNILDNMRRFKKCNYPIKRSDKVLAVFNNFDDYHSEETLWQISEKIKPRGGVKKRVEPTEESKPS